MDKIKKAPNLVGMVLCDPDKIQTCNRWSRNPVRYSVAPQGHVFYLNDSLDNNRATPRGKTDQNLNPHCKVNIADKIHNINSLIPFVIQQKSNIFVLEALLAYKLFLCDYLLYLLP